MQGLELVIEEYESPKRGKGTKFKQLNVYESEDLFNVWSSSELANWKLHESRDLKKSRTDDYKCNYSRLSNYGCQMKLKIRRPHDSENIIVEQSYGVHEHQSKKPVVLNESVKKIVCEDKTLSAMQMQDKIQVTCIRLYMRPAMLICYKCALNCVNRRLKTGNATGRFEQASTSLRPRQSGWVSISAAVGMEEKADVQACSHADVSKGNLVLSAGCQ